MMQDMEKDAVATSFKSYVIFDLETTTLPCFGSPKITEISAIAVLREHIKNHCTPKELPRILNKLTLCVYPQKMIPPDTEKITGLSNMLLEDQSPFDERVFNILSEFIARMPKPVCLLAHNGNRFDFPILQAEVFRLGKVFPNDLWCADSLPAFRFFYSDKQFAAISQDIDSSKASDPQLESLLMDSDELDSAMCDLVDSVECVLSQSMPRYGIKNQSVQADILETSHNDGLIVSVKPDSLLSSPTSIKKRQKINETTPKRPSCPPTKNLITKYTIKTNTTVSNGHYLKCRNLRRNGPVKSLADMFDGVNGPKSFKLVDIYQFICDIPPVNPHNAEADSIMLLHCIVGSRDSFLEWVDKNAVLFNSVKKMW